MRVIKANDFSFDRRNKDYFTRKDNRTCERLLLIIGGGEFRPRMHHYAVIDFSVPLISTCPYYLA